ncbi:MAG TPA: dihydroneopterin aldolase [Chloroflexia bacterium]|jgi:dihydroneopterin aldolase
MSSTGGPEHSPNELGEIRLTNMVFFGTHGANPEETALGQRFAVNLSLWLDISTATRTDRLEDTVSYSAVYKLVRAEVEGEASKLLEHLAGRILDRVLHLDPRIAGARVEVGKLSPPLKGSTTAEVSVVLERQRASGSST